MPPRVILLPLLLAAALVAGGCASRDAPARAGAQGAADRPAERAEDAGQVVAHVRAGATRTALQRPTALVYRRNDRARVPRSQVEPYLPLYRRAAAHYGVSWLLLASIHKQETAFSTARGTYKGLNFARCCAGPMQFNLKNKPVSTWRRFGDAYRTGPPRPVGYPHRTARHPSPYDDWDAILAAARLLAANGADAAIAGDAWRSAYLYYGPGDLDEDDFGITYADEVIARALGWQRRGFCSACATDSELVAAVHVAWAIGPSAEALEEDRRRRAAKRRRERRAERAERRREARERRERRADRRATARRRSAERTRDREPASGDRAPARRAPRPRPPAPAERARPEQPTQPAPPTSTSTSTTPSSPPPTADESSTAVPTVTAPTAE